MSNQITLDGEVVIHYKDNPNIIASKNCSVWLFKDVNFLHCLGNHLPNGESHGVPFNTKKKFYLLNHHGWGWCENHMKGVRVD